MPYSRPSEDHGIGLFVTDGRRFFWFLPRLAASFCRCRALALAAARALPPRSDGHPRAARDHLLLPLAYFMPANISHCKETGYLHFKRPLRDRI